MDTMEMTGPSTSERELKSMQSVRGSLIAENFSVSSMMPKNLQGAGGGTVLPAPSTVSVSTLQFCKDSKSYRRKHYISFTSVVEKSHAYTRGK